MDICAANHAVSVEVRKFLENVDSAKEESITDYLVWKWREIDKRFNYLRVTPFSRDRERVTGADFELELWLVGRTFHLSFAVQAKKFIKRSDSYVRRLRYPNNTKAQMNKLLAYSRQNGRLPLYFIYTLSSSTICPLSVADGAIYVADALVMEEFADGKRGKRVSLDKLLKEAKPFHCMFCCLLGTQGYFEEYFHRAYNIYIEGEAELPSYARRLLDSSKNQDGQGVSLEPEERVRLRAFRFVAVYDMRE
ncbi:hypothetical protein SY28_09940 [Meiothermus taiwanensis]|nr:hypothetical protein SY28_09940 [Meiothermus taiwanensis]KZK16234.1 hypothetical protein A3962_06785 [Meiothermus taiwanensis]